MQSVLLIGIQKCIDITIHTAFCISHPFVLVSSLTLDQDQLSNCITELRIAQWYMQRVNKDSHLHVPVLCHG